MSSSPTSSGAGHDEENLPPGVERDVTDGDSQGVAPFEGTAQPEDEQLAVDAPLEGNPGRGIGAS